MTKSQHLGVLRAVLTSLGAVLATYGIQDGNAWLPVIGVILTGFSLGWGVIWHKDPAKPGKLKWSLLRKFSNAVLSACATYGWMHPDQASGVLMLVSNLGPLIAMYASWIDNGPEDPEDLDDEPPSFGGPLKILLLLAACSFLLPGCTGLTLSLQSPWGDATATPDGAFTITPRAIVIPVK